LGIVARSARPVTTIAHVGDCLGQRLDLALYQLLLRVLQDALQHLGLCILPYRREVRVVTQMDKNPAFCLIARHHEPAAPAHRVVFVEARSGKFHARHAIVRTDSGIDVALHQTELKFAGQIGADGDVGRGFHIEVVGIPDCKTFTKETLYKILHNRMYLGDILHKGQSYPGQHQALIAQDQWDAVHALIATDAKERNRSTRELGAYERDPALLRGLLFTGQGERLVPSCTVKKGKRYRYYTSANNRKLGAWACQQGPIPATPIEEIVTQEILSALSAPSIIQAVWEQVKAQCPDITEPEVVLPMRQLAEAWRELYPVEQCRLAQLLIDRVVLGDGGLEIIWSDLGWESLAAELLPGTIGAELQEMEDAA
jgi:Recombinase.